MDNPQKTLFLFALGRTFSHWYNTLNLPICFDILKKPGEETVIRYELKLDDPVGVHPPGPIPQVYEDEEGQGRLGADNREKPGKPEESTGLTLKTVCTFTIPHLDARSYSLHRISSDLLLTMYGKAKPGFNFSIVFQPFGDRLNAFQHASPSNQVPSMTGNSTSAQTTLETGVVGLNLDPGFDLSRLCSFTFCAMSARVAYSSVEGDGEVGRHVVRVFDYSRQLARGGG